MCWAFAFGIPVYFWWVSLKEKDRKKSFSPCSLIHTGYSPWITCGRDAAVSGATFSSFSSLLPFCFLPFILLFLFFFLRGFRQPVTQEADSGGRTGWPAVCGDCRVPFWGFCSSGRSTATCLVPVPILPPHSLPMGVPAGQKCSLMQAPVFT